MIGAASVFFLYRFHYAWLTYPLYICMVFSMVREKGLAFVQIPIDCITLVTVAFPEGASLVNSLRWPTLLIFCVGAALTFMLALAFTSRRTTEDRLLVRILGPCEKAANASVTRVDTTGTLARASRSKERV